MIFIKLIVSIVLFTTQSRGEKSTLEKPDLITVRSGQNIPYSGTFNKLVINSSNVLLLTVDSYGPHFFMNFKNNFMSKNLDLLFCEKLGPYEFDPHKGQKMPHKCWEMQYLQTLKVSDILYIIISKSGIGITLCSWTSSLGMRGSHYPCAYISLGGTWKLYFVCCMQAPFLICGLW